LTRALSPAPYDRIMTRELSAFSTVCRRLTNRLRCSVTLVREGVLT
jgi:hypothetical protein